jgi:S1-C subfamily serine protease
MLGDVITAINNEKIESSTDLFKALDNRSVGESVAVEVQRGNRKENVNVALKDISSLPTEPNLSAQDVRPLEPGAEEGSPFGN